jgi:hypothetical protein
MSFREAKSPQGAPGGRQQFDGRRPKRVMVKIIGE